MKKLLVVFLVVLCSGCSLITRTIYIPHGQAVRLRQEVKNVKVWVKTKDGEIAEGKITLPEGWYCLPSDD